MGLASLFTSFFIIMEFSLGPVDFRFYSGDNWTHFETALVTNRNGGMARRETAVKAGFKSDHVTDMIGKTNHADVFTCPDTGKPYYGKIVDGPAGRYTITAKEVYTKELFGNAVKQGLAQAETATTQIEAKSTETVPAS